MERTIEVNNKDEELKTHTAVQSAKSALLISSLRSLTNRRSINFHQQEEERKLKRENEDLKMKLVVERRKNLRIGIGGVMELLLMTWLCIALFTLCLLFAFNLYGGYL